MADIEKYTRGSAIDVIANVKKYIILTNKLEYDDPENGVFITISNKHDSVIVDNQPMIKSSEGKYYYTLQTTHSFVLGLYKCTIDIHGIQFDSIHVTNRVFNLVENDD